MVLETLTRINLLELWLTFKKDIATYRKLHRKIEESLYSSNIGGGGMFKKKERK